MIPLGTFAVPIVEASMKKGVKDFANNDIGAVAAMSESLLRIVNSLVTSGIAVLKVVESCRIACSDNKTLTLENGNAPDLSQSQDVKSALQSWHGAFGCSVLKFSTLSGAACKHFSNHFPAERRRHRRHFPLPAEAAIRPASTYTLQTKVILEILETL